MRSQLDCTTPDQTEQFKLYPTLGRAALATGQGRAFRWWSILREEVTRRGGCNWFTTDELIATLGCYGLSRPQAYEVLQAAGDGSVWFGLAADGRLFLRGLQSVCVALETLPGRPVLIDRADVAGRITLFKASIHAATLRNGRKVSRGTLATENGISPSTQRRYEAQTGVEVRHNYIRADVTDPANFELPIPDGAYTWDTVYQGGRAGVVWQAPNYYKSEVDRARPGLSKHVARFLRSGFLRDEAERRTRYLVDDWKGKRGTFAGLTDDTWSVWHPSGRVSCGPVYEHVTVAL